MVMPNRIRDEMNQKAESTHVTEARRTGVVTFHRGWTQTLAGDLIAGDRLSVEFDQERLPQLRQDDARHWGIDAFVTFLPGGMTVHGPVRADSLDCDIPLGTTQLQAWLQNWAEQEGLRLEAFDSRYGANYEFPVMQQFARSVPGKLR